MTTRYSVIDSSDKSVGPMRYVKNEAATQLVCVVATLACYLTFRLAK